MTPLTEEQVRFATGCFERWLDIRREHERKFHPPTDWDRVFSGIAIDADHSALLYRLLHGREPLPEPPPTAGAYPVYPDQDEYGWRAGQ